MDENMRKQIDTLTLALPDAIAAVIGGARLYESSGESGAASAEAAAREIRESYNLRTPVYGAVFLDAYGRNRIDGGRLRVCGLLAAME